MGGGRPKVFSLVGGQSSLAPLSDNKGTLDKSSLLCRINQFADHIFKSITRQYALGVCKTTGNSQKHAN